jgi:hypothetical protein
MIRGMKSTKLSVLVLVLADRLASNAELSSIASQSNFMRAFVLKIMLVTVGLGVAVALLFGARAQTTTP